MPIYIRSGKNRDLSENRLTKLPKTLWDSMTSLRNLQLSRNKLVEWINFDGLINLEDLDLTGNSIETLGSFRSLRKLKRLKLVFHELINYKLYR